MLEWQWLWALYILPVPLLIWLLLPAKKDQAQAALKVPFLQDLPQSGDIKNPHRWRWLARLFVLLGWCCFIAALARPVMVGELVQLPQSGRNIMLAVDLSLSMQEADYQIGNRMVDRLTATKFVAGEFIERREGDRIGLVLFGDQAYLQAPLTFDRQTVRRLLDESALGLAGRNTAIGDAIGLALKRLKEQPDNEHILVLMTDGENTAGVVSVDDAAEMAKKNGLKIYTVGIGAQQRASRDFFGNRGSSLDEETLIKVAEMTGGRYFRATDTDTFRQIYAELDRLEPIERKEQQWRPRTDLFFWPLAAALLLVLLGLAIREKNE
ncbi:vWA domain-containing protein [Leucothrix arctica]|uniref:BatB protein n=1 Tax=Leucothrix arctica TaxID=1481894 RepID=A0A317CCV5_9GAMM|nr:VWA domain-containing protein [Leucothrix arctica]PWQ94140.1 BatB protein [Leucothrix arctica]